MKHCVVHLKHFVVWYCNSKEKTKRMEGKFLSVKEKVRKFIACMLTYITRNVEGSSLGWQEIIDENSDPQVRIENIRNLKIVR